MNTITLENRVKEVLAKLLGQRFKTVIVAPVNELEARKSDWPVRNYVGFQADGDGEINSILIRHSLASIGETLRNKIESTGASVEFSVSRYPLETNFNDKVEIFINAIGVESEPAPDPTLV